ncbi:MAG: 2-oxo acid dehydrogenase subunit E2 [Lachnospiraceae bacterium]|nr:2-oxo acid dehydrogenase subunit E2 [Lachnospiraceae bacterium]
MSKEKERRKFGDRFDGKLIKKIDPMHVICPILYPNRCDNEAYIAERIDMAPIRAYLEKLNKEEKDFPYTTFHIIVTAILKTLTLRPKLNRFVANKLMYQRNKTVASFVVKKLFSDEGEEALALVEAKPEDTMQTIHQKLFQQISVSRSDVVDKSSESMDIVSKMPRRLTRAFCEFICFLDRIGKCPKGFIETDPYYTSCVLSNLGSLHLHSGYHHLTNWGTCSLFCIVGEIKKTSYVKEDGTVGVKETVDLGLTVDERLADGYYCAKSIRLLEKLLANPELLELPMGEEIEY